jgi:threonine/homoserine/homoserine lactone efflux protein
VSEFPLPVDPSRYIAFLGVMFVMALTPGPANLFAIAVGLSRGKRAVLAGVAGMNAASLTWFVAAALGLGALILAFPKAFHVLAIAGGLYVAWLGIKAVRAGLKQESAVSAVVTLHRERPPFVDGFLVQAANPKAILFFTAVLPPFLDVHRPLAPQLAMFAVAAIGMDVIAMSTYGLGGAALSERMAEPGFRRGFSFVVGALLLSAAALILWRG